MAELYLAQDTSRGNAPVVIKRILPYLSHEPDFVQMFLDEARIASQLHHPNVVRVHELGQLEGSIFISMEYVEGHDLRKVLSEEQKRGAVLPYGLAAYITAQVAAGLHYAHFATGVDGRRLSVIHRDVSPQNVMVGFDGRVKLVDFGIAKAGAFMERSKPGVIKGKFLYLAPEQLSQERLDHRADLFALGTMLYELTTGKSPFQRGSTEAIIFAIRGEEPDPPERHRGDYPRELSRIILKCLVKDRAARYQTGAEVQAELEAFVRGSSMRPSPQLLSGHVAELFGLEQERTAVHRPGPAGEPEVTQTLPPPHPGARYEPDEELRTQAVNPSELAAAIAGRAPSLVALPVRRAIGTELTSASGAGAEQTVPLRGAPGIVMSASSAPTVPPTPQEAEVTANLDAGPGSSSKRRSSAASGSPVPDEAEPTSRLRPGAEASRPATPGGPEVTALLSPVRASGSGPQVRPARRASRPASAGQKPPPPARDLTPEPREDDGGEPTLDEASQLAPSVSATEEGGSPPGVRESEERTAKSGAGIARARSRPLVSGVLLGIGALSAAGVLAALFWGGGAAEPPRMRPLGPRDAPARASVAAPAAAAAPAPAPAPTAAEPFGDPKGEPVTAAPAPNGSGVASVVFRAPRGTVLSHGPDRLAPNEPLTLPVGEFAYSYRCPGKRQRTVHRTVAVRSDGPKPQSVSVQCKSR